MTLKKTQKVREPKAKKQRSKNTLLSKILSIRLVLILFALVPIVISTILLCVVIIPTSYNELKVSTENALVSVVKQIGYSYDTTIKDNSVKMMKFVETSQVVDCLRYPDNSKLVREAKWFVEDTSKNLQGWDALYISDWNTEILVHLDEEQLGKKIEDEAEKKTLLEAVKNPSGIYNAGIKVSPQTGECVMNLYSPVYNKQYQPIGYVAGDISIAGTIGDNADVSSLGLESAYVYFVSKDGTIIFHPDKSKTGTPIENQVIKDLLAQMEAGEHPDPAFIEYDYNGARKYAAFYVGSDNSFISVLAADESNVMGNIRTVVNVAIALALVCVAFFTFLAFFVSRKVSTPLTTIANATEILSKGDVTVECNVISAVKETNRIIEAFQLLKTALSGSLNGVKDAASSLSEAIYTVDEKTAGSVSSVSDISRAISEVASTSQTVATSAQIMADKASELGGNVEELNDNVTKLFEASTSIKSANEKATDCMRFVDAGANESVKAVHDIAEIIEQTNRAVEEISSAITAIETIASKTNLLSLNASIEAARAGEAGRGFAVVATEIRTLADSSATSAKEIKAIIDNVVELSNQSGELSDRVCEVINKEKEEIETAQERFNVLSESVAESIDIIEQLRTMADNLDIIKNEMTSSTNDLGAVSEELGASAEEVASLCQNVASACNETQESTVAMRTNNEQMQEAIAFFKL